MRHAGMTRMGLLAFSLGVASCSLVTDFSPNKSEGTGGSGGSGAGGFDATVDRAIVDATPPIDATPDARPCTVNADCSDGFACTIDVCAANGFCRNVPNNNRCAMGNVCFTDVCMPADPNHDANGCARQPVVCPGGQVCDPQRGGCVAGNCVVQSDCQAEDCCTPARCVLNVCQTRSQCGGNTPMCCPQATGGCLCQNVCP